MIEFKRPNIMIAGSSGWGKSSSLRNLNPETTIILNTERRPLPFKHAPLFKKEVYIDDFFHLERMLANAIKAPGIEVVVIESFTSAIEMAYNSLVRPVEKVKDNVRQAWQVYKDRIHDILTSAKAADRYVVFTGIDSMDQDESMRMIRTVHVQGSLKGMVEKEFDIVLWAKIVEADKASDRYKFLTNTDGVCKAKSPMGMFDELYIENDLASVIDAVYSYYTTP